MVGPRKTTLAAWQKGRSVNTGERPGDRLRLRPWLLKQLEQKPPVTGLAWLSLRDRTFRISWRHAARQGWDPNIDADLFEKWAKHTGGGEFYISSTHFKTICIVYTKLKGSFQVFVYL